MLNRVNLFLLGLLLIQAALLAAALVGSGAESSATQLLLQDFDIASVDGLTIADDLDKSLSLALTDSGWALPAADAFPVDAAKVEELLAKLSRLDRARIVAANPANFPRLLVAEKDFRRRLDIRAGERAWTLYLGGSGGADTAYARLDGEDEVYLGLGLSAWDASTVVTNWIDASYVGVPEADLLRVELSNDNGAFSFVRDGADWLYIDLPEDAEFEDTTLPGILRNASSIRMVRPLGVEARDEYGMTEPSATVKVTYRQLLESDAEANDQSDEAAAEPSYAEAGYTLLFGAELDDGNVALKSSDSAYYVAVRDSTRDAFRDISHESLLRVAESDAADAPDPRPAG